MLAFRSIVSRTCRSSIRLQQYSSTKASNNSAPDKGLVGMTSNAEECRDVYDNWASDYGKDVEKWGYDTPDQVASLLTKHYVGHQPLHILDAGAGDGLSGKSLRKSFPNCHLTGADLSSKMLQVAEERGCYDHLQSLDLNQPPFPFQNKSFDVITCVGTMTYVDPAAGTLKEFCRIVKPEGMICYSNRTDKLERLEDMVRDLEEQEVWSLVEKAGPLPYLPNHPDFKNDIQVVVFLYQRTDKPLQ